MDKSVKVLLVSNDDSVFRFFSVLFKDTNYYLIRPAEGFTALGEVKRSFPGVVLIDIDESPGARLKDLCEILADQPKPVMLVTKHTDRTRHIGMKGLNIGAVEVLAIPDGLPVLSPEKRQQLMNSINTGASLRVSPIAFDEAYAIAESVMKSECGPVSGAGRNVSRGYEAVGVAISTGGPNALSHLIPALPAGFPVPILVVQHIIPGFLEGIISRLDKTCDVNVKLAEQGERLAAGTVYFAPDKLHLKTESIAGCLRARLSREPADLLFCPSADILFGSMAESCGSRCIAVIMTGMGHDGVEGIRMIKKAGGTTVAQDRQSSVIYGMARVAVDAKLIDYVVPLQDIAGEVYRLVSEENQDHSEKVIVSS